MTELAAAVLAMIAIVAGRYLAVSGFFAWLTGRVRPGLYGGTRMHRQMRHEIGWSLAAAAIYGAPAGLVMYGWARHGWTKIYTDIGGHSLLWLPLSILAYLFVHDSYFYWTHRAMHRPRLFRLMHAVHHDSRPPTAWAAMSFHPWEALSGAILIPALTFLIPIHVAALGIVLGIMTFFGVTNHMGWEIFPKRWLAGPFGAGIISASHHHKHHADYRCNFGLYFRIWDRLCDTDRGLSGDLHAASGDRVRAGGTASDGRDGRA
jgi:sterol desaturase/sphingolipid hydroxylase (fatty acid hydroxylase superfamily)